MRTLFQILYAILDLFLLLCFLSGFFLLVAVALEAGGSRPKVIRPRQQVKPQTLEIEYEDNIPRNRPMWI